MKIIKILLLISFFCTPALTYANEASTIPNNCGVNGIDYNKAVELVMQLQNAIKLDDPKKISSLIHYPLTVNKINKSPKLKPTKLIIKNPTSFIKKYNLIITKEMKDKILAQNPQDIFCNYQGAMIASGAVWFNTDNKNKGIFTINSQP